MVRRLGCPQPERTRSGRRHTSSRWPTARSPSTGESRIGSECFASSVSPRRPKPFRPAARDTYSRKERRLWTPPLFFFSPLSPPPHPPPPPLPPPPPKARPAAPHPRPPLP